MYEKTRIKRYLTTSLSEDKGGRWNQKMSELAVMFIVFLVIGLGILVSVLIFLKDSSNLKTLDIYAQLKNFKAGIKVEKFKDQEED